MPGAVCVVRLLRAAMQVPTGEVAPFPAMAAAVAGTTFPMSVMIGLAFPAACAAARRP